MTLAIPQESTSRLERLFHRWPRSMRLRLKVQAARRRDATRAAKARGEVLKRIKAGLAEADLALLNRVAEMLEAS